MRQAACYIRYFLLLSIIKYGISVEINAYKAEDCADGSQCLFPKDCMRNSNSGKDICICRKDRALNNHTKKCEKDFYPLGFTPWENGTKVDSVLTSYEMLPDAQFTTSEINNAQPPSRGRLYDIGWCMPIGAAIPMWWQVDFVVKTTIRAIRTQAFQLGVHVKKYNLEIGNDPDNLDTLESGGVAKLFDGGDEMFFINPSIKGRYVRLLPKQASVLYCMKMEFYGDRTIDECKHTDPINHCHVNRTTCTDTEGAYRCKCDYGFHDKFGDGSVCELINECTGIPEPYIHNCSKHADCTDIERGFKCKCKTGFNGDGYYCEDLDECTPSTVPIPNYKNRCHKKADCNNTIGSYICFCKKGYSGDGYISCKDVNECSTGRHDCHQDAVCTNSIGSYDCRCRDGYTGDGKSCEDINECESGDTCHKNADCTNKPGQYQCQCRDGFNGNGKWCEDVNECLRPEACRDGAQCHNKIGNFTCMCPQFMPLQYEYAGKNERTILDEVVSKYRDISKEDFLYPIDYHAHIVRTIYQLLMNTYDYRFLESRESFSIIKVVQDSFGIELYDLRCTDIETAYFPNLCHPEYAKTKFENYSDIVEMPLNAKKTEAFEHWATEPPPKAPKPGDTTPTPPPVIPFDPRNVTAKNASAVCGGVFYENETSEGEIMSPGYDPENEGNYPPHTYCVWTIVANVRHNAYIVFDNDKFEIEFDKKCINDYVEVRDGNVNDKVLGKYCGRQYATAQRSGRRNLTIIFKSDENYQYIGFKAKFHFLSPRVSLGCITYNPMASLPKSRQKWWEHDILKQDKSVYVPVSRLLACQMHPKCVLHKKKFHGPLSFTFQHFRTDRNDKKCIRWSLLKFGRSYDSYDCWRNKTNKTHTVCHCKSWGIVGVVGRITYFKEASPFVQFRMGTNAYISIIFVVFALLGTLIFLILKDQWGAVIIQIFTMKEYDSGRVIQLHIVLSTLLAEIFFSIITFNVEGDTASCFILVFIFYYLLQTVFFWLFIYTLFLASRVHEIFDSETFNSYKIYLIVGYILPFLVTLTLSGLNFTTGDDVKEKLCWLLFTGTTVWGFSGVIITLGVGTLILQFTTVYNAMGMENGIILQEKCVRTIFTTFFVLLTTLAGAQVLRDQRFGWEYMFALCNLLQGFSIAIMYCILKREDPIIKSNQIGPIPDFDPKEKPPVVDADDEPQFKDMEEDAYYSSDEEEKKIDDEENESETEINAEKPRERVVEEELPQTTFKLDLSDEKAPIEHDEAMVDEPEADKSDSDDDQEILFRMDENV